MQIFINFKENGDICLNWRVRLRLFGIPENMFKLRFEEKEEWGVRMPFLPVILFSKDSVNLVRLLVERGRPCYVSRDRMAKFVRYRGQEIPDDEEIIPLFSFQEDEHLKHEYGPSRFFFQSKIRNLCRVYLEDFKNFSREAACVSYEYRYPLEEAIGPRRVYCARVTSNHDVMDIISRVKERYSHSVRYILLCRPHTITADERLAGFLKAWSSRITVITSPIDFYRDGLDRISDEYYGLFSGKPILTRPDVALSARFVQHLMANKDIGTLVDSIGRLPAELQISVWLLSSAPDSLGYVEHLFLKQIMAEENPNRIEHYGMIYGRFGRSYIPGLINKVDVKYVLDVSRRMNRASLKLLRQDIGENKPLFIKLLGLHPFLFDRSEKYLREVPLYYRYFIQTYINPYDHRPFYIKDSWKRVRHFFEEEKIEEKETISPGQLPLKLCIVNTTTLSYHGRPCRDIYESRSRFVQKLCPSLYLNEPVIRSGGVKKVGFISPFLGRPHSVFRDRHGVIQGMSKVCQVYVFLFDAPKPEVKRCFGDAELVPLPKNIDNCSKVLMEKELDCLVFCELGLDTITYFLAHRRFAPLQINTWGHSDTCGIKGTIDIFVSSRYFNKPEDASLFTEKLFLMNSLSTYYKDPSMGIPLADKKTVLESVGIKDVGVLWSCLQTNTKLSESFWCAFDRICNHFTDHLFVILIDNDETKRDFAPNVRVVKRLPYTTYMRLISVSDVTLDPFPFGGCNSSLEAFSFGVPVLTYPSNLLSGSFTAGFYKAMRMNEWAPIAANEEEYVDLAKKLGEDVDYRRRCATTIRERASQDLFHQKEAVDEWISLITGRV